MKNSGVLAVCNAHGRARARSGAHLHGALPHVLPVLAPQVVLNRAAGLDLVAKHHHTLRAVAVQQRRQRLGMWGVRGLFVGDCVSEYVCLRLHLEASHALPPPNSLPVRVTTSRQQACAGLCCWQAHGAGNTAHATA